MRVFASLPITIRGKYLHGSGWVGSGREELAHLAQSPPSLPSLSSLSRLSVLSSVSFFFRCMYGGLDLFFIYKSAGGLKEGNLHTA